MDTNDSQSSVSKDPKLIKSALENRVMELMKEKPSVTQLEIAKRLELSRIKVQSAGGTNFILLKILCGYKMGTLSPEKNSNSGHLDWKVREIGIFQSFFLFRDVNMMLRKQVHTFLTFKLSRLKILSEYGSILLGVTKMVGGWPSPEGLCPSAYIETLKGIW